MFLTTWHDQTSLLAIMRHQDVSNTWNKKLKQQEKLSTFQNEILEILCLTLFLENIRLNLIPQLAQIQDVQKLAAFKQKTDRFKKIYEKRFSGFNKFLFGQRIEKMNRVISIAIEQRAWELKHAKYSVNKKKVNWVLF